MKKSMNLLKTINSRKKVSIVIIVGQINQVFLSPESLSTMKSIKKPSNIKRLFSMVMTMMISKPKHQSIKL
jgi:hypothetical protein